MLFLFWSGMLTCLYHLMVACSCGYRLCMQYVGQQGNVTHTARLSPLSQVQHYHQINNHI